MTIPGWLGRLIGRFAVENIKDKPMTVQAPTVKKIPLASNQYYQGVYAKKQIILHHTAGGSAASSIAHWASNPDHIATPYVIDRDGTIYECFDPKYWAYHLGAGIKSLEQSSIGIEICSYGSLAVALKDKPGKYKKGDFLTYTGRVISADKTVKTLPFRPNVNPFIGNPDVSYTATVWEAYTPEQIAALKQLIPYLCDRFKITLQTDRKNFLEYQNPSTLPPGIWSHTTVRKDKIDVFPQPDLIQLVESL